jgi:hypothetical protein
MRLTRVAKPFADAQQVEVEDWLTPAREHHIGLRGCCCDHCAGWATKEEADSEETVQRSWGRRFFLVVENRQGKLLHTILGVAHSVAQKAARHAQNGPARGPRTKYKSLKTM